MKKETCTIRNYARRAAMTLLLVLMTAATARAELASHIDYCEGAPGCVFITGWVYDQSLKHWQTGAEIEVSAFLCKSPNDDGWDARSGDVEYVVRDDVNTAFGLSGKHGFRMSVEVPPDLFEQLTEMPLYVKIYATVNNGNGYEDILLNSPYTEVTVTMPTTLTTTSTYNYDDKTWTLYSGFTATGATGFEDSYGNIVDGNLRTGCGAVEQDPIIEFCSSVPIILKGYNYTNPNNFDFLHYCYPVELTLKAKAFPTDEWTELFNGKGLPDVTNGTVTYYCNNAGDAKYRYFQVIVDGRSSRNVYLSEFSLFSYYYNYLPARAATCTETGISQDCYLRSDGRYFADDLGVTELNEADVVLPMVPHTGVHHAATDTHIEYWQCSMCGRYFSDADCTTQITEESIKIYRTITIDGSMSGFISSDINRALTGTTVTLTLSHLVDAATLQVNSGAVATSDIGNRHYTFTVPAADVTVTATLLPTYAITLPEHTQLLSASLAADGSGKYIAGTVITFKFMDAYAALVSEVKNGETGLTPDEGGVYTVTMEDADVIVTAKFDAVLADGTAYTHTSDAVVPSATYTKTLSAERVGKFQAWFVPFDYTLTAEDLEHFAFYKINMIANAPNPDVEASDEMWVFLKKMGAGTVLHANMPYVYKPLEAVTDYAFTTTNATLKAKNTDVLIMMMTAEDTYTVYGTYENTSPSADDPFYYVSIYGKISLGNNEQVTVGPYRWIIRKTSKFGDTTTYAPQMRFFDEDGNTTGITTMNDTNGTNGAWYTMDGRRLSGKPTKRGIYIVNGKKTVIK